MAVYDRLEKVFRETFQLPAECEVRKLRYREAEQWDSLGHMTLVVAIEDEFDVELSPDDALAIESFEVAATLVGERTGDG